MSIFCIATIVLMKQLNSELNVLYLDDGTADISMWQSFEKAAILVSTFV
jgi:hypothetical protein